MPRSDNHASPDGRLAENYLTRAFSVAVATTGGCVGRRSAAAPKSRADLACGGSHENAWVIVPAGAAASIIS